MEALPHVPTTLQLGDIQYEIDRVVERPQDQSQFGAGTYIYMHELNRDYTDALKWRANVQIFIREGSEDFRFISWNTGITLGRSHNQRVMDAVNLFLERRMAWVTAAQKQIDEFNADIFGSK